MITDFGTNGFLQPGGSGAPAALVTGDQNRGLAYNAASNHLYLANKNSTTGTITILNGDTGATLGSLNMTGIAGGTFPIDQIAVDADGAIYATNLTTNAGTTAFKVYRWADESSAPAVVYSGNPGASGARFGDSFTARGSGTGVQLLAGASGQARAAILSGFDPSVGGSQFSAVAPTVSGAAAGAYRLGVTFGAGNSFYGKQTGSGGMGYVTFDIAGNTATQAYAYSTPTPATTVQQSVGPIGADLADGYLVGIFISGATQQLQLYDLTGADTGAAPTLLDSRNYPGPVTNANAVGQVVFGNGRFYALDTNNGIAAFTVAVPEPGTVGLAALGAAATLVRRRRR